MPCFDDNVMSMTNRHPYHRYQVHRGTDLVTDKPMAPKHLEATPTKHSAGEPVTRKKSTAPPLDWSTQVQEEEAKAEAAKAAASKKSAKTASAGSSGKPAAPRYQHDPSLTLEQRLANFQAWRKGQKEVNKYLLANHTYWATFQAWKVSCQQQMEVYFYLHILLLQSNNSILGELNQLNVKPSVQQEQANDKRIFPNFTNFGQNEDQF